MLLKEIHRQLATHQILIKIGAIVNASVVETPLKTKGNPNHKVTEDRKEEKEVTLAKDYAKSKTIAKSTLAGKMQRPIKIKYRSNLMGVEDFNFLRRKQFEVRCFLFHAFLCVLQRSHKVKNITLFHWKIEF